MLSIRPGFSIPVVLDYLKHASNNARNVLNSSFDADKIGRYLTWAANEQRTLGAAISPKDMDRLVTTRTYWALVSAGGVTAIALLDNELRERIIGIEAQEAALRQEHEHWASVGWTTAVVLDTVVLMQNHAALQITKWHEIVHERPMRTVRVMIPLIVIDELDSLKRSSGNMMIAGKAVPQRTLARQALRTIAKMFPTPRTVISVNQSENPSHALPVMFELLPEPAEHVRLANADSEIRDRALALTAYTDRVVLATYDLGNKFASGLLNLEAIRLIEDEDKTLGQDLLSAPPRV